MSELTPEARARWFGRVLALQCEINVLSSVAIEYPSLRSHPLLHLDDDPASEEPKP